LDWYKALFQARDWYPPLINSVRASVAIAIIAPLACAPIAYYLVLVPRLRAILILFVLLPVLVPAIALANGTFVAWIRIYLFDTLSGLVVAHFCYVAPIVTLTLVNCLTVVVQRYEARSQLMGASAPMFVWRIVAPLVWRAVVATGVIAAVLSFQEVVLASFATDSLARTLPVEVWHRIRFSRDTTIAALLLVEFAITIPLYAAAATIAKAGER
jgi:putative spermidine/putrescine transport system permease protein